MTLLDYFLFFLSTYNSILFSNIRQLVQVYRVHPFVVQFLKFSKETLKPTNDLFQLGQAYVVPLSDSVTCFTQCKTMYSGEKMVLYNSYTKYILHALCATLHFFFKIKKTLKTA